MADLTDTASAGSVGPASPVGSPAPGDRVEAFSVDDVDAEPTAVSAAEERARLIFLAVFPLAFGLFYLWQVLSLPAPGRPLVMPPRAWPLIAAVAMVLVAAGMTTAIATRRWRPVEDGDSEELSARDVAATFVGLALFIVVFERLGFLISTSLLVFALATLTSPTKWKRNLVVAIAIAVVSAALFDGVLGVDLPAGILTLPLPVR